MAILATEIRLEHRMVGSQYLVTSPDVPELHVAHRDRDMAYASVQSALDMIANMKARRAAVDEVDEVRHELYA